MSIIRSGLDLALRAGSEDAFSDHGSDGLHEHFGVHVEYEDLYDAMVFLAIIWVAGQVAQNLLFMPALVGEIFAGILLGPPLADFVPYPSGWVLFGEFGLVLLVLEAGIDIDVPTLKLIGTRGVIIAVIGSLLPIGIGMICALIVGVDDMKEIISAGATFGPTSVGIALNVLRTGGVLNTPVGQLVVSAAVIDDMIALIILSQLEALVDEITVAAVLTPLISAVLFLVVGGAIALFVVPRFMNKFVTPRIKEGWKGKIEMVLMFTILLGLMPATYYGKASYLMGAFVAGLAFCTSHELHHEFVKQFKQILAWLMRIFFAAAIGFQVPITDFGDADVIWKGLVFCLTWLIGKILVGLLCPNFGQSKRYRGYHLRDCLIVGNSMAAEGEFAFVIAVYCVDNDLIGKDLYASLILAVLISTIIPPFMLRTTINFYNKKSHQTVQRLMTEHGYGSEHGGDKQPLLNQREKEIAGDARHGTIVFWCVQVQSKPKWGLLQDLTSTMNDMGLDVIDHRCWNPRGLDALLNAEMYVRDPGQDVNTIEAREEEISKTLHDLVDDETAPGKVTVSRWLPGVMEEVKWENMSMDVEGDEFDKLRLEERIVAEAGSRLSMAGGMSGMGARHHAEIIVNGKKYDVRISDEVLNSLNGDLSADQLDNRGVEVLGGVVGGIEPEQPVASRLQGYVRNPHPEPEQDQPSYGSTLV